ncbi:hypothetical protein [Alysiella filiformis]|uniref:Uncharacterized protein n=1 Tax=Alysiella filiformis DSM 16848 TaxID=1120981 RepID=A0A286E9D1_9NEIS|nr:hypothetical protein [Alysiella filiformis]QMT31425.1 hypothetical protein H3L97_00455 [Alysiella filiformis]UBQ55567.1 hypothetical protein JF568_08220 [Alysiella filiformis DSM 16848]SOD67518.1 hypothetical protein SAMN02746062_00933 [Alysiella filiformis DSM 16848]
MRIYSHIVCPKCRFLYCHHIAPQQLLCSQCLYQWQEQPRPWIRHATWLNGKMVQNPNVKDKNPQ